MIERSVVHHCCYGDMWFGLMCGWGVEMEQLGSTQSLMAAKFCNGVKELLLELYNEMNVVCASVVFQLQRKYL
jgi:hypothetical protein